MFAFGCLVMLLQIWMVVEAREGWIRVAEAEPVHLEVWVRASSVVEPDPAALEPTNDLATAESD